MDTRLRLTLVSALTLLVLAACQLALQVPDVSSAESSEGRITTEQEFRTKVVGKKNISKSGHSTIHKDGSITGNFRDKELTGTWTWEGEYFCRTVQLGDRDPHEDCQVIIVSGDEVSFIRKRGEGKTATFQMEESK